MHFALEANIASFDKVWLNLRTSYNPDKVRSVPGQQRPMNSYLTPEFSKVFACTENCLYLQK